MSRLISTRLRDDLATALDTRALLTDRSRSWHIERAIEAYLDDQLDLSHGKAPLATVHPFPDPDLDLP